MEVVRSNFGAWCGQFVSPCVCGHCLYSLSKKWIVKDRKNIQSSNFGFNLCLILMSSFITVAVDLWLICILILKSISFFLTIATFF